MSQKVTAQETAYISLVEAVALALTGKDDLLLSLNNAGKAVLFDGTAPAFAVMVDKAWPDATEVKARMLGKGGTVRVIQSAAIAPGAQVMGVGASARVATAAAGSRVLGTKLTDSAGAAGDVIEIADIIERAAIPSVVTAPAATAIINGAIGALNSTAVNPTKADFDALLAAMETLADEHRADNAKLIALHTALVAQGIVAIA